MGRLLLVFALLYGCGHPACDGYRPASFDRPLRDFHRELNETVSGVRRTLAMLDDARHMRHLTVLVRRLDRAF